MHSGLPEERPQSLPGKMGRPSREPVPVTGKDASGSDLSDLLSSVWVLREAIPWDHHLRWDFKNGTSDARTFTEFPGKAQGHLALWTSECLSTNANVSHGWSQL